MATIAEQAAGFKAALARVASLRAESEEPSDVNPTQGRAVAFPILREIAYDEAFSGATTMYTWDVVVIAAPPSIDRVRGQQAIDPYIAPSGADSIVAALYVAPTLPVAGIDTVDDLKVTRAYDRGLITIGDVGYWGAKLECQSWS